MSTQDIVDEDAIDTEALQAQIDLSMSFAQDLVSSWMAPHKSASNSRKKNLEQELADYMKRPPRLGVGAVIPEGGQSSMTRETARLKGKLAGKKRPREEEDAIPSVSKAGSDDEAESRVSAIKKKARPDPFDVVHGKKKKKVKETKQPSVLSAAVASTPGDSKGDKLKRDSSDEILDILNDPTQMSQSPTKSEKRKKDIKPSNAELPAKNCRPEASNAHFTPSAVEKVVPSSPEHKPQNATLQESLAKTPGPKNNIYVELLKTPLLNLSGPINVSDPESEDDVAAETPSMSPKKKRKRRKKKKNLVANESLTTPSV